MDSLLTYTLRRLAGVIPLLFGLVTIVFFLSRILPGDVTDTLIAPSVPPSVREQVRSQLGLDRPVLEQYIVWLRSVASGDLGTSFTRNESVLSIIGSVLPNTVILAISALFLEFVIGILLVLPVFFLRGKLIEKLLSRFFLALYAVPSFWIGMLLLLVFSYGLGVLPSSQMYSSQEYGSLTSLLLHLILPSLTVALPAAAGFARYLRQTILTVQRQEFVLFAQSLGLSPRRIFRSYVLPNAASPLISLMGVEFGVLMAGVLVTETLFSWPGMGQLTVHAIFSRDYPLVMGCVVTAGAMVVLGNLLADVANALLDPRIRLTQ